jgi:hypothetical protein
MSVEETKETRLVLDWVVGEEEITYQDLNGNPVPPHPEPEE